MQHIVGHWAGKYKVATSAELRALFKKVLTAGLGTARVSGAVPRERVIDPPEKVLARELCGPWVHRFETRPAAVGDMINGLPKVQEHLPEFGIDALQHAQICRHLLAWAADVGSPLDLKRTVARQRPMQNVADLA